MNEAELASFKNAVAELNLAAASNDRFLEICSRQKITQLGAQLLVLDPSITLTIHGHTATAVGRQVHADKGFATEYVFEAVAAVPHEPRIEVWRCYVDAANPDEGGGLYADADLKMRLCDLANAYIADLIARGVAAGIRSTMFLPRPLAASQANGSVG